MTKELKEKISQVLFNIDTTALEAGIAQKQIFEILDKYNNQENKPTIFIDCEDMEERYGTQLYIEYLERHKKAWDELINLYVNTFKDTRSKNDIMVLGKLKELSKKHNLDNKQVVERVDE